MQNCTELQGRLRRGGLTLALAPRMPVTTEDVCRQIEAVNATEYCQGVHKKSIVSE